MPDIKEVTQFMKELQAVTRKADELGYKNQAIVLKALINCTLLEYDDILAKRTIELSQQLFEQRKTG